MARVEINIELCKGCGLCIEACPKGCLKISSGFNRMGEHPAEWCSDEMCTGCGLCVVVCPDCAISIYHD